MMENEKHECIGGCRGEKARNQVHQKDEEAEEEETGQKQSQKKLKKHLILL